MATRTLLFARKRHYAALSGRMVIINILTQGVASLALGYVVLGFQPVLEQTLIFLSQSQEMRENQGMAVSNS